MKININELVAGPKLDGLVAEHYMDWTKIVHNGTIWRPPRTEWEEGIGILCPPLYSVDTSLAFQIVTRMSITGLIIDIKNHVEWSRVWCFSILTDVDGDQQKWTNITGPTVEVVICRSALWVASNPIPQTVLRPVQSYLSKEKRESLDAQSAKATGRGFAGRLTTNQDR
jgi:hypothetical protein